MAVDLARLAMPFSRFLLARARGDKFPLAATLSLTNRCNFRCVYCRVPDLPHSEMPTADWLRAIDELAEAGLARASVMGGEPLLREDCGEIIVHLKRRRVHASMNTNGWLVEECLKDVLRLDLLCVSLDGPRAVMDAQRRAGSYERAVRAIELARRHGLRVVTMTVVTPANAQNIDHVLTLAREIGFRAHFHLEHDADCHADGPIGVGIDDAGVRDLAQTLLRRKNEGWPVGASRSFLDLLAAEGRRFKSCSDCFASRYFCHIMPDGTVVPCLLTHRQPFARRGPHVGFLRAFHDLAQPQDSGCSCEPLQEMNLILSLRSEAIWNAVELI